MDRPLKGSKLAIAGLIALLVALVVLGLSGPPALAKASKPPKGAIKVNPANVVLIAKGIWCAKSPGNWKSYVPGKRLLIGKAKRKKTYFISALQQAKQARSAGQAKRFEKTHRRYLKKCQKIKPLRFNIKKAIGVAKTKAGKKGRASTRAMSTPGELDVLLASGAVRDAIASGEVTITDFELRSNGNIFVWLSDPINLNATNLKTAPDDPELCGFIEVERATGIPTCVDNEVLVTQTTFGGFGGDPVQVDSNGILYYLGITWRSESDDPNNPSIARFVLRRKGLDGVITDLVRPDQKAFNFQLLDDGGVLVVGEDVVSNGSGSGSWLKRIGPPPALTSETLLSKAPETLGFSIGFMLRFTDGNVYLGTQEVFGTSQGTTFSWSWSIDRYLQATKALDPTPWIAPNGPSALSGGSEFCGTNCVFPRAHFSTPSGRELIAVLPFGYGPNASPQRPSVVQLYPQLYAPPTRVSWPVTAAGVGERAILVGREEQFAATPGQYSPTLLTLLDLPTGSERTLLGLEAGIDISQVQVAPSAQEAFFAGKRVSDGRDVLGRIDLASETASVIGELENEWLDFQTFGSD